jgi:glycosyltransferase involved in cell wall biosynthesis
MNLLLVDSIDFPYGGAHSVHVELFIKGLRKNLENISLIIPYGSKREATISNKNKYGHFNCVPYYFVRRNRNIKKTLRFIDIFIGVVKTACLIVHRKKKRKLDAVIISTADLLRDSPVIFACKLCHIPLYFWFVEKMSLAEDLRGISGFLNYNSQKLSEKILPRLAKGVIVISSRLKDHYLKYLPDNKILINPILVSEDMNKIVNIHVLDKVREKLQQISIHKKLLVYSGSYGEKDGVFYLIDAFKEIVKKYPETLFIMTGKNHNELIMDKVKDYIINLNLEGKIQLLGFVNSEDLFCYNYLADILFACRTSSPYANHGFPWKLGEYCMTGKPIIATRVSDIEVYFKDDKNLFIVEPNDSSAIIKKIDYIFNNYEQALMVGEKGKEAALNSFDYIKRTKELSEFIVKTRNSED